MSFYYICNECKYAEKREGKIVLACPNCDGETLIEVEPPSEEELQDLFAEHLGDLYGAVRIGILEYAPADVLRAVDPPAYRCKFNDWLDSETSEGKFIEFDGQTFYAIN